jgi:simple sugar transport system ATP-binding protein/ribose transport system ATP-binding protein
MAAMLGRSLDAAFPAKRLPAPDARSVLEVRELTAPGVNGVSFELRAGEILGLAGLVGAGRTEVARAICRANRVHSGSVSVLRGDSAVAVHGTPRSAMRAGVLMIPESRKEQGLLLGRPVRENVSLSTLAQVSRLGMVQQGPERRRVRDVLARVDARGGGQSVPASALSGGNQQKLLFARSLLRDPAVLIADEPTRGVDVGAKRAIYELLTSLTEGGLGVLLISSDVEEILGLAHRVLVMRGGRITAELIGDGITEAAILSAAFGADGLRDGGTHASVRPSRADTQDSPAAAHHTEDPDDLASPEAKEEPQ